MKGDTILLDQKKILKDKLSVSINSALKHFEEVLDEDHELFHEYIKCSRRYNSNNEKRINNLISYQEHEASENLLTDKIIHLIDSLSQNAISEKKLLKEQFLQKILVVTTKKGKKKIKNLFSSYYFKNIEFDISESVNKNANAYDLIICDYFEGLSDNHNLIKKYLKKTSKHNFVLFYGRGRLEFQDDNKKYHEDYKYRTFFANSTISLYARIKEMIEFRKYYNG